jgi:hypothetical protein
MLPTASMAVDPWYHEYYDPGYKDWQSSGVGHFTAMIWEGVRRIGCFFTALPNPGASKVVQYNFVCEYASDQGGCSIPNALLEECFNQNVFPALPNRTIAYCSGVAAASAANGAQVNSSDLKTIATMMHLCSMPNINACVSKEACTSDSVLFCQMVVVLVGKQKVKSRLVVERSRFAVAVSM